MPPSTVAPIRTPRQYYDKMSLRQRQCRGRVFHKFPDLDPTAPELPAGYRILYHDADGNYFIQETCECCGRLRFSVSVWENGHFHPVARYRYADPDDDEWMHVPYGVITAAHIRGFLQDDCALKIKAAARASERQAKEEARAAERQAKEEARAAERQAKADARAAAAG